MKIKYLLYLFLVSFIHISLSQSLFQRTIGGSENDFGSSAVQTADGYVITGQTSSFGSGNSNIYVIKIDTDGNLQWSRAIGGSYSETSNSIIRTSEGGYALAGQTVTSEFVMYIAKLDANGNLQWNKTIGDSMFSMANSVIQTSDGGYALAGYIQPTTSGNNDMYIVKLDQNGALQWSRVIGNSSGFEIAASIVQTSDGGYAAAGYTNAFSGNFDMFIVKFSSNGTYLWSKTIGGTSSDAAHSMILTSDGGFAIAGTSSSFGVSGTDMYVVKLDANAVLQWSKTIGGQNNEDANSIIQTADGSFIIAGSSNSFGSGNYDMYIVKLDVNGTIQWSKTIGGSNEDRGNSVTLTPNGGYSVTGYTRSFGAGQSDMYIVRTDANGNACSNFINQSSTTGTGGTLISQTPVITNLTPVVETPSPSINSGGLISAACNPLGTQQGNNLPEIFKLYQNYPNPFNPSTSIKFKIPGSAFVKITIYNATGKIINQLLNEEKTPGNYEITWDGTNFASGVYFYKIEAGSYSETKKMLLIK